MNKRPIAKFLQPFVFHNILSPVEASSAVGEELIITCPFCNKEGHFGISLVKKERIGGHDVLPGHWHCLRCDEGGGILTLMQLLYEYSARGAENIDKLAHQRGLRKETLVDLKVRPHMLLPDTYMVPVFDEDGTVFNIYKYDLAREKPLLMGTPTRPLSFYGLESLTEGKDAKEKPVIIVEGHWDRLALHQTLKDLDQVENYDLLAVPGVNSFKQQWCRFLAGRAVILVYDYDKPKELENGKTIQPGQDGLDRTIRIISRSEFKPSSLHIVDWRNG